MLAAGTVIKPTLPFQRAVCGSQSRVSIGLVVHVSLKAGLGLVYSLESCTCGLRVSIADGTDGTMLKYEYPQDDMMHDGQTKARVT